VIKGSTSATRVLDILDLADPLGALEVFLASRHVHLTLLLAGGILFVFYAILGRAFCGWVCPLGLLLELNHSLREWIRRRLRRKRIRLPNYQLPKQTKYWVLGIALVLSLLTRVPAFQVLSPINILTRNLVFGPGWGILLVVAIVAVEYVSERVWCRALCPLGAFYSLVGRFSPVRVRIDHEKERGGPQCGLCNLRCPMGIAIVEKHVREGKDSIDDPECTRCGTCVDYCLRGSLQLGVTMPRSQAGRPDL